ncbi:MAG: tetratricopeptide repeat protein [Coriobacteriales bacterium]|nr:tetratricopeptide repeat protein [Coriobacteriales bacterium]
MASKPKKELDSRSNMSTGTKVVIGVFAVIMALSMMLPSLTSIFAHNEAEQEETEQQEETADQATDEQDKEKKDEGTDEDKDKDEKKNDGLDNVPDNESLKSLADDNKDKVEKLTKRYEEDPKNLATLLNLANTYMNWGYSAKQSSSTDEEKEYSQGLLKNAVSYFDSYLELHDSNAAKVDRALCQYYMDDSDDAIESLEKLAKDNPDYPLVWANLGMLYEQQGESEKASDAYKKAVETDPNDEYGAKSYGNSRLIALNSKVSSPSDAGDAGADKLSKETESGLTSTLSNSTGLNL